MSDEEKGKRQTSLYPLLRGENKGKGKIVDN